MAGLVDSWLNGTSGDGVCARKHLALSAVATQSKVNETSVVINVANGISRWGEPQ